jgi:hypothetical protein
MTSKEVVVKDERLFDVRVVERNIRSGRVTREEYEAYLAQLSDAKDKSVQMEADFVEGVLLAAQARQARRKAGAESEQIEDED